MLSASLVLWSNVSFVLRASQQIGEIHVVLGLEDRGEIIKPMSAVEKHIQVHSSVNLNWRHYPP